MKTFLAITLFAIMHIGVFAQGKIKPPTKTPPPPASQVVPQQPTQPETKTAAQIYNDGVDAYNKNDYTTAFNLFSQAAIQGYSMANYAIGEMYREGHGQDKNYKEAEYWYKIAAQQGVVDATYWIGYMYFSGGYGLNQNLQEAFYWFRNGAEKGDYFSQTMLGILYENGNGTKKDLNKAVYWYRKAAAQGFEQAKRLLQELGYTE